MFAAVLIWGALVPVVITGAVLAWAWRRREGEGDSGGAWAAAAAIAVAYAAGSWGMNGWGAAPPTSDPNLRLVLIALIGGGVGLIESLARLPRVVRWGLRIAVAVGAAWLVVGPLVEPQQWGAAQIALRIGAVAGAALVVWTALDLQASTEQGPSLAMALALIAGGGSAAVLFSGLASSAQVEGVLIASLGVALLLAWRRPAPARLRSAAPVVALLLVGHAAVGLLYADLPPLSFALLALTPLGLLAARLGNLRRARAVVAIAVRLAVVGVPVGVAVGAAAIPYFGLDAPTSTAPAAGSSSGDGAAEPQAGPTSDKASYDEDYGY